MARATLDRESYLRFSRAKANCLLCNEALNVDGSHPSTLVIEKREEAVRQDFCRVCWDRMAEKGYFSFWVTKRVNAPTAAERRLARSERNDAMWRLFAGLYAVQSSELQPQLFLLAHLLMRYKILTFLGLREGKLCFLHAKLEDTYHVEDLPFESIDFVTVKSAVEEKVQAIAAQAADATQVFEAG
jgi:hypothetical protein